jgi:hypothetical protein
MPSNSNKSILCKVHNWNIFMVRGAKAAFGNVSSSVTATEEARKLAADIEAKTDRLIELLQKRNYPNG